MPQVIAPVVGAILGSVGTVAVLGTTVTAIVSSAIFYGGIYLYQRNALKKRLGRVAQQGGTKVTSVNTAGAKELVFGRVEKSGSIIALGTSGGSKNPFLEGIIAFAGNKINRFTRIKFNGEYVAYIRYSDANSRIAVFDRLPTRDLTLNSESVTFSPSRGTGRLLNSYIVFPKSVLDVEGVTLNMSRPGRSYTIREDRWKSWARSFDPPLMVTHQLPDGNVVTEEASYVSLRTYRGTLYTYSLTLHNFTPYFRPVGKFAGLVEFRQHLGYSTNNLFNFRNLSSAALKAEAVRLLNSLRNTPGARARINQHLGHILNVDTTTHGYWISRRLNSQMRGEDVGLLFFRIKYDQMNLNRFPNIVAELEGNPEIRVYDRNGEYTLEYSTNPVWQLVTYLTDPRYGLGASVGNSEDDDINLDSCLAAAAVCDEEVIGIDADGRIATQFPFMQVRSLPRPSTDNEATDTFSQAEIDRATEIYGDLDSRGRPRGRPYVSKRYTGNGWISLDESHRDIIAGFLSAFAGEFVVSGSTIFIHAGGDRMPDTVPIEYDDVVSPISVTPFSGIDNVYSGARGQYSGPLTDYNFSDFPPQVSPAAVSREFRYSGFNTDNLDPDKDQTQAIAKRFGEFIRYIDTGYPMTNDPSMCQRLARIELLKSQLQTSVSFTMNMKGLRYRPGDIVKLNFSRYNFEDKLFKITDTAFDASTANLAIKISAVEYNPDIYNYLISDERILSEETRASIDDNPELLPPRNFRFVSEGLIPQPGAGRSAYATLEWDPPENAEFISHYEIERDLVPGQYTDVATPRALRMDAYDLEARTHSFRIRSVGSDQSVSAWSEITFDILAQGEPPPTVENIRLQITNQINAIFTWGFLDEDDVNFGGSVLVRYTPTISDNPIWENAEPIAETAGSNLQAVVPYRAGTYLFRSRSNKGRLSAVTHLSSAQEIVTGTNIFNPINEAPNFEGLTYPDANFEVRTGGDDGQGTLHMRTMTETDTGLTRVVPTNGRGIYPISRGTITLQNSTIMVLRAILQYRTVIADTTIDARDIPIDQWVGQDGMRFDDVDIGFDAFARVEFRTASTGGSDPVWSDWQILDSSTVEARQLQFRVVALSGRTVYAYPAISRISIVGTSP